MQVRRWWYTAAVAVCVVAAMPALGDPPPKPGSAPAVLEAYVKEQAEKMKTAKDAGEAQSLRVEAESFFVVPKTGPGPNRDEINVYAKALAKAFGAVIDGGGEPYVGLNGIILLADVKHIDTDGVLRAELANGNPGVRYWAAKGLAAILPDLKPVAGAYGRAVDDLIKGVATEKIAVVRGEMAHALGATLDKDLNKEPHNVPAGLAKALGNEAAAFAKGMPSAGDMNAAAAEMDAASDLLGTGMVPAAPDTTALMQAAADALSFAAQQGTKNVADAANPAPGAALDLAQAAVRLFKAAAPATAKIPFAALGAKATNADLLFAVNDLTGSNMGAGVIEKVFPDVKPPGRLK